MNNYLTRLLTRSSNKAEVVQPRPLSLFEPLPAMGKTAVLPTPFTNMLEETTFNDTPLVAAMAAPAQPPPRSPMKSRSPVHLLREAEPVNEPAQRQRTAVFPPETQTMRPQAIRPQPPRPPLAAQAPAAEPPVQPLTPALARPVLPLRQEPVGQSFLQPLSTWSPTAKEPENLTKIRQEIVREQIIEQPVVVHKSDTVPPQATLPSTPAHPSAPIHPAVQPQIRPFVPPQTRLSPEPQPEATPTIHVTIGRIEVRATPLPASPTRKERHQAPTMGLDEYLRQRNGGQP